ncbi:autotransporter assembly complex protein TamA [Vibrio methylphosphonaticus]|uniref:autotransporter assembly complex protein TamA n=1 Tax=Vibrio methylphosphonaticus TaxID=2946866 RepID=UPI00202A9B9E|nr:autotransporter assembly complex family protein [Vibrio methylphosphonaticus]MCL9777082.1 autotransporter assembly complex protein TamA [Vibrio methylphosphonaticus]
MIKRVFPPLMFMIASMSLMAAEDIDLNIKGLSGPLKDNVDAYVSAISPSEYSTSLRFQSRITKEINSALNALGYYHADIKFSTNEQQDELMVEVTPGQPMRIKLVDVELSGEAKEDADFLRLIRVTPVKEGKVLNQGEYDTLKSSIRNLALQKGYFDGAFTLSRLEVVPELNQAFVRLHFDSGIRYKFGSSTITGSQIDIDRVQSLQPYKSGDYYQVGKVGEFNQGLSNTEWFSSVFVEPDLEQVGNGRELPMKVSLAPQVRNQFETGLGYSTDVGAKVKFKWKKPWINSRGHSFNTSLDLSIPEQQVTAAYKIPLDDVLRDYYVIQYGLKNVNRTDKKTLESNLGFERHWVLDSGWHRTAYIRYLVEDYERNLEGDVGQFVLPGLSYSRVVSRGGVLPMSGNKQTIMFEVGDKRALSETSVFRVRGTSTWISSIGENHRGLFKVDVGANIADDPSKLSPSLRFYAGGDNSIRGYDYESISPVDTAGIKTGGQYLATSTLEYQYRIYNNWWAATFFDVGDAFDDTPVWKRGAGVGIRWVSPVGPIKFDFAKGLDQKPEAEWRIHFSLGPEL